MNISRLAAHINELAREYLRSQDIEATPSNIFSAERTIRFLSEPSVEMPDPPLSLESIISTDRLEDLFEAFHHLDDIDKQRMNFIEQQIAHRREPEGQGGQGFSAYYASRRNNIQQGLGITEALTTVSKQPIPAFLKPSASQLSAETVQDLKDKAPAGKIIGDEAKNILNIIDPVGQIKGALSLL